MKAKRARPLRTLDEVVSAQMRDDPEFGLYHLSECAKDPEPRVFLRALKQFAESRPGGLAGIARKAGVDRAGLHRALAGPSMPNWSTITRLLRALNLDISFQPGASNSRPPRRRASA
jgi:probable addiction module antidote protein